MSTRIRVLAGFALACTAISTAVAQPEPTGLLGGGTGSASPPPPAPQPATGSGSGSGFGSDAGSGSGFSSAAPGATTPSTATGILQLPDEVGSEVIEVTSNSRPTNSLIDANPLAASDNVVDAK